MRTTHYRNLDILRAFAVALVFVNHIGGALVPLRSPAYSALEAVGRFGVILFFFHTSFVLMQSIEAMGAGAPWWIRRFYIRRAFRIYPLSILTVIAAAVTRIPIAPHLPPAQLSAANVAANLLLLINVVGGGPMISPLWSLPVEIEMYCILPFLYLLFHSARWKQAAWCIVGVLFLQAAVPALTGYQFGRWSIFAFTGCFAAGCLSYRISRSMNRNWPAAAWLICIAAVTALGVGYSQTIAAEWTACFILGLVFPKVRDMRASWFTKTGELVARYSYGIYLSHMFAIWLSFDLWANILPYNVAKIAAAMAMTAVISVLTYHIVEEPLIQFGKRLSNRIGKSAGLAVAAGR
ncbi:MAG TPA: acyltransferase [Bryobacteraceae bacterium]|nr:acyltransferase [Bryobacteraceae bacterium]